MKKLKYYGIWTITILFGITWLLGVEGSVFFASIVDNYELSHKCLGVMWLASIPFLIMTIIALCYNEKPAKEETE